jgi:O-antigen/teichoic acid export membrane protein
MSGQDDSYSDRITRNTFYNAIARVLGMLISFFLTPYILSHLGVEYFGIWSLVWVLTGYLGLLDLGLGTSFVRYTSLYYVKGEKENLRKMMNSGLFFYMVVNIFLLAAVLLFSGPILSFFNFPSGFKEKAAIAMILGVISLGLSNLFNVFNSVLYGFQRFDLSVKIGALVSIPLILGTIFVLESGYGLIGLMYNYVLASLFLLIAGAIITYKILGDMWKIGLFYIRGSMLKKLVRFGLTLQLSQLSQMVSFNYDKMLISHFLGVAQVTYYEIGSKLTMMMRSLPAFMTSAITPAASEMEIKRGLDKVWELYSRGTKYLLIAGLPLFLFVTLEAREVIFIWIGKDYELSTNVVRILSMGYFLNFICSMASSVTWGIGKVNIEFKFGFLGAAIGTSLSLTIGSIYFFRLFKVSFKKTSGEMLLPFLKPVIAGFASAAILFFVEKVAIMDFMGNRVEALLLLCLKGILFVFVYAVLLLSLKYLDDYDKALILEKTPVIKNISARFKSKKNH